ncbi:hypothetical protein [Posidoniimonas polymericola]|uniref:hypothetical protein n=1 Tax=Posidoniimonas polymericola TaxID=2528002 RepID=UPI0018D4A02E|nr:hypothetical protein [Posidoniimonas polymericola]
MATPSGLLVAVFARDEKRYTHRIEVRRPGEDVVVLLQALSGRDPRIPASPPLHGLNVDEIGYAPRPLVAEAKLIGMSTDSSWRVALGPAPGRADALRYAASCRLASMFPEVRSSYRAAGATLIEKSNEAATLRTAGVRWRISLQATEQLPRSPFCRIELPSSLEWSKRPSVAVVAEPAMNAQPPLRLGWCFEVSLEE